MFKAGKAMKSTVSYWSLLLLLCAASAHAQLYKWIGPDGSITYSDTPPPRAAALLDKKPAIDGEAADVRLPYELAQAVKGNPVTLYTTAHCPACDEGRKLLAARGIPFTEKTVTGNDDIAQLKQAGGDAQLPFLTVGRNKQQGFESGAWNNLLNAAGYPQTNHLPKNYRNPQAQSAAPKPQPAAADQPADSARKAPNARGEQAPPAAGDTPPGFRF
jgi:glutaredoxin